MTSRGSVTQFARQLSDEDRGVRDEAARQIWERYTPKLLVLVRRHLAAQIRQREDEHDVLQSMYKSFFRNQRDGKYLLKDRDHLWNMLVLIAMRKVANAANYHKAKCRDVGREQAAPASEADDSSCSQWLLKHIAVREPDPAKVAAFSDAVECLLLKLPEDLRQIVLWKVEGYTNREIGEMIKRTERAVEMKLRRIRHRWQADDCSLE